MPLDLGDLLARVAEVDVDYGDGSFAVRYRPEAITVDLVEALGADEGDDVRRLALLVDVLARVVAGWDVTEEGIPLPVTPECLRRFPLRMLVAVVAAITADVADPNRTTAREVAATPSPSGSSAAAPSVRLVPRVGTG